MAAKSKRRDSATTILLVEDNEMVRSSTALCLQSLDYRVLSASHGPEALKIIESGEPVDILLTDVIMPGGMTGQELADTARARVPNLRVLLISGYPRDELLADGRIGRNISILAKPIRLAALAEAIRDLLARPDEKAPERAD